MGDQCFSFLLAYNNTYVYYQSARTTNAPEWNANKCSDGECITVG